MNSGASVELAPAPQCRLAFTDTLLFVNGRAYPCDEVFSRALCDGKIVAPLSKMQLNLLVELLNDGSLLIVT
ncbi:MAG: hypothetical protein HKN70_12450 [Gammaproteobacteria bacterium]|nr:hypothetical protein [Gammaproteobacteria bacterium]